MQTTDDGTRTMGRGAMLLLGPTGSGKTPLGEMIERCGLRGARCVHFDFGANLRRVAAGEQAREQFSRAEIEFLRGVLQSGALLEEEQFAIARRVLQSFLAERGADERTVIALNGLPRHVGQAESLGPILRVATVVHLDCAAEVVAERIGSNIGGDRAGRVDDDLASVRAKLATFAQRTAPLVAHYQARGARIVRLVVTAAMTPQAMWQALERSDSHA